MKPTFFQKHPLLKDFCSLLVFIAIVILGAMFLTTYIYRSYNVVGPSMENTLKNDDHVFVNRAIVTWKHFLGEEYIPERGQIIVFANEDVKLATEIRTKKANELGVDISEIPNVVTCNPPEGVTDQYIVKRVIAFPGERVVVKDGVLKVYNEKNPDGYIPDIEWRNNSTGPKEYTSGEVDITVPEGELFVSGDNREGSHSWDSRNGLGTVPFCRVIGPVFFSFPIR